MLLFLNATTADAIRAISLLETQVLIYPSIILCPMVFFLKDGIGLDSLELGLEVANGMTVRAAVGTTTGIGEVVTIVLRLVTGSAPGGMMSFASFVPKSLDFTNCLCLHPLSSPSLGRRRRDQTWRSSEGGAGILRQCRQRGRHGHGRSVCESESLNIIESAKWCDRKRPKLEQDSRTWEWSGRKRARRFRKVDIEG